MTGLEVKLINWDEGNYRVSDKPNSRGTASILALILSKMANYVFFFFFYQGEICLSGLPVAKSYYNLPSKTAESFVVENGKKWFRTGDIGEFDKNGEVKVCKHFTNLQKFRAALLFRHAAHHRPQEGLGEAAAGRVRLLGEGGGTAQDSSARREYLRLWRLF